MTATQHPAQLGGGRFTRYAWWSLLGFVPSFALSFLVGEGLLSALGHPTGGSEQAPLWVALAATLPALVVFLLPALLAVHFARRAMRLGDVRARTPMIVGLTLAAVFIGTNVFSGLVVFLFS